MSRVRWVRDNNGIALTLEVLIADITDLSFFFDLQIRQSKRKMSFKFVGLPYVLIQILQILVFFTHLKL